MPPEDDDAKKPPENTALLDVGVSYFYAKRHSRRQNISNFVVSGFGPVAVFFIPFSKEGKWSMDLGLTTFFNDESNFAKSRIEGGGATPVDAMSPNFGIAFKVAGKHQALNLEKHKISGGISADVVYYSRKTFTNEDSKALFAGLGLTFDYKYFCSKIFYLKIGIDGHINYLSSILSGKTDGDGDDSNTFLDAFSFSPSLSAGLRF